MNYILVTPARDEEQNLPLVIEAVTNQTTLPRLWVIVDDGSKDGTPEIVRRYQQRYDWIRLVSLPRRARDVQLHYAHVCRVGFDYAIQSCERLHIDYEFICLLDADTVPEKDYFRKIMLRFAENPRLGIASGGIYYKRNGKLTYEFSFEDEPRGTGRVWSRKCFLDTGGYAPDPAMHTISNVKAKLRGYDVVQFRDILMVHLRKTSSEGGFWHRYLRTGEAAYYIHKRLSIVIAASFYLSIRFAPSAGASYLLGYLNALSNKNQRIEDPEIRDYFKNQSLLRRIRDFVRKR